METLVFGIVVAIFIAAGIWIGSSKSGKDLTLGLVLFPNIFKTIGIIVIVLSIIFVAYSNTLHEEIWKLIGRHCLNLGLFIYCFSRDKLEDELIKTVRLRSFYTSVIAAIIVNVLLNFLNFVIVGDKPYIEASDNLVTIMLGVYAFSFGSLKRKVFYGK
jgi:hypothetical protein